MRAPIAGIVIWAVLPLVDASAATKLMPAEIQSTFFTGEAFNATTPSGGVKFKMVFTPDGKVTRTPLSKGGARGEGSWKLARSGSKMFTFSMPGWLPLSPTTGIRSKSA